MPATHKAPIEKPTDAKSAMLPDTAALLEPSRLLGEMCAEFGVEVLRLASRRLAAQAELMDQLAHTKNLAEAMERQMHFLQRASADYAQTLNGAFARGQARVAGDAKDATPPSAA